MKRRKSRFISKKECHPSFFPQWKRNKRKYNDLIGEFRCYSLHCGGILSDGIPENIKLSTNTLNQIKYNKDDV